MQAIDCHRFICIGLIYKDLYLHSGTVPRSLPAIGVCQRPIKAALRNHMKIVHGEEKIEHIVVTCLFSARLHSRFRDSRPCPNTATNSLVARRRECRRTMVRLEL